MFSNFSSESTPEDPHHHRAAASTSARADVWLHPSASAAPARRGTRVAERVTSLRARAKREASASPGKSQVKETAQTVPADNLSSSGTFSPACL